MELYIKEANNKYTLATIGKQEAQEELAVCEEVTRTLNREKLIVEEDRRILKSKYEVLKEKLSENRSESVERHSARLKCNRMI